MPRLFVAIAIPEAIKRLLKQKQSQISTDCRIIDPTQWHITLQFIGDNNIDAVDNCLRMVAGNSFSITLDKPGYFGRLSRGAVLWWGVKSERKLMTLQASINAVLAKRFGDEKIRADMGGYQPHITLARCKTKIIRAAVDNFLQSPPLDNSQFTVAEFGLYSSKTDNNGAIYTLEKSYPLKAVA